MIANHQILINYYFLNHFAVIFHNFINNLVSKSGRVFIRLGIYQEQYIIHWAPYKGYEYELDTVRQLTYSSDKLYK